MQSDLWLNLPSKDLKKAKDFFVKVGFEMNQMHQAPHMVSMFIGTNRVIVNLFDQNLFREFIGGHKVADATSTEVLFSIGANSPQEVDTIANKVTDAGGTLYGKPGYKDGWMYGCGFIDLDGHRWNILYMDMSKMPKPS